MTVPAPSDSATAIGSVLTIVRGTLIPAARAAASCCSRPAPDDAIVSAQIAPGAPGHRVPARSRSRRPAAPLPRLAGMACGAKCLIQVTVGQIQRPPILTARWSRSTVMPSTAAGLGVQPGDRDADALQKPPDQAELPVGDAAGEQDRCLRPGRARPSLTWSVLRPGTLCLPASATPRNPRQVEHVPAAIQLPAERAGSVSGATRRAGGFGREQVIGGCQQPADRGRHRLAGRRQPLGDPAKDGQVVVVTPGALLSGPPPQPDQQVQAKRDLGRQHRDQANIGQVARGRVPRSSTLRTPMHSPFLISGAAMMEVGM